MTDSDGWQPARLIPVSGISGPDEAERRATSALLAVMQSVREFRIALLKPVGAPAGSLESFIEVPFTLADDRTVYPDGLLQVTRGQTRWTALIEVKTGSASLEREQVENYLDAARDQAFDAVVTISNELAPAPGVHPVKVDKRKLRKVELHHLSWAEILTAAVRTRVHRGVEDPDQAWILGELIRYLEHPRSGALDFADMGPTWVEVRDATIAGTLRATDKGVGEVASRWDQLLRFCALRLGRELGADVHVVVGRKDVADPAGRLARFAQELASTGTLTGSVRIPDAVGDLDICCDLRAGTAAVSIELAAPQEGRLATRVAWLLRQLKESPGQLRIDGLLSGTKASTSELLSTLRDNPDTLIDSQKRDFRAFRVTAVTTLGAKRGTGRGAFIDSVLTGVDGFYECVVQALRPWTAKAPRLPAGGRSATDEAGIDTTPPPADRVVPDELVTPPAQPIRDDIDSPAAVVPPTPSLPPPSSDAPELTPPPIPEIEWSGASARLERERRHDEQMVDS